MHVGIDLGTTNSAIATFDGQTVSLVTSSQGEALTPSVVRVDARGNVTVGRRAWRFLESDPANTRSEFKRLMGTPEPIAFEASGREYLPEDLSSFVLASLLADARDSLGYAPCAAVISTPALFELPQNHATMRAARKAGLGEVTLIQEPIASAIAAGWSAEQEGLWLVFDLGGGTLDVSLLETKGDWLRVVDHGGDNFLGGKDLDNALVDWALERITAVHPLPELTRSNPQSRRTLAKLKAACEQARIELSRAGRSAIACAELCEDAEGLPVEVDLEIARAEFEVLVDPLVERCLAVCRELLAKNRTGPEGVARVVFVGGPTLTPVLRGRVGELFGGRVAEGVDPMAAVARGAALYAATVGLEARPAASGEPPGGLSLRVEHPAVTGDVEPFVVGRFFPGGGDALPARVRIERQDREFVSPDCEVSPEGAFVLQVRLERRRQNRFRVVALARDGTSVPVRSAEFTIVHGISVADPPLSRSVGVALSHDVVHRYFDKGTPLPARRTFVHETVQTVAAHSADDVLHIPVVQGEYTQAHLNRLIGSLQIPGSALDRDLPAGTRVEVTLRLDRSGQLEARADVPGAGLTFEDVVHVLVPTASVEVMGREIDSAEARVADVRRRAFRSSLPEAMAGLEGAARLLAEARAGLAAARGGDTDAAQRVHRLLLDMNGALDAAEVALEWPELEDKADSRIRSALSWVSALGTPSEQALCEQALAAASEARQRRNGPELDRQISVLSNLANAAWARDPRSPGWSLDYFAARLAEATDARRAQALLEQGRKALARKDTVAVRAAVAELDDLFPGTPEERRRSFGSGLR